MILADGQWHSNSNSTKAQCHSWCPNYRHLAVRQGWI